MISTEKQHSGCCATLAGTMAVRRQLSRERLGAWGPRLLVPTPVFKPTHPEVLVSGLPRTGAVLSLHRNHTQRLRPLLHQAEQWVMATGPPPALP